MEQTKTIGRDYTLVELMKFAAAPIFTDFALSLLRTLDDGLFIMRYIGPNAMAAFSIFMSMMQILDSASALLGGCASLCAAKMGEGKGHEAAGDFTTVTLITSGFGFTVAIVGHLFLRPILTLLGANEVLMPYCYDFANIALWYFPLNMLTMLFGGFYVTAGKPKLSMFTMLGSAVCNILFDYIFVARMQLGMVGVAYANLVGTVAVLIFDLLFYNSKYAEIGFDKPTRHPVALVARVAKIGFPRMISTLTLGISSAITNNVLLSVGNESAVSAYTIINNIQFMFMSAFFGLYSAVCPLASYAYGARDGKKLGKVIKQAVILTGMLALFIILLFLVGRKPITQLYLGSTADDTEIVGYVNEGLLIAPLGFAFFGFVVLGEHGFAAIQNTTAAAVITASESLIFSNLVMLTVPRFFGVEGVWWTFPIYQGLAFLVALFFFIKHRDSYGYGKSGKATIFDNMEPLTTEETDA